MRSLMNLKFFLNRHPVIFQSLQTGVIMGLGDVVAQVGVEKKNKDTFNYKRLLGFSCIGFFFVGPALSNWFMILERTISPDQNRYVRAAKKVLLDQTCFAPCCLFCVISLKELITGSGTYEGVVKNIENNYLRIMTTNYKVWPAYQLFNFSVVPLQFQVLANQLAGVLWNAYLSFVLNQPEPDTSK